MPLPVVQKEMCGAGTWRALTGLIPDCYSVKAGNFVVNGQGRIVQSNGFALYDFMDLYMWDTSELSYKDRD